jgi:hypothetical protein
MTLCRKSCSAEEGSTYGTGTHSPEAVQQLAVMHEVGAKELRDGEDPLSMADVGDHLVLKEGRELRRAFGPAGWAEAPALA